MEKKKPITAHVSDAHSLHRLVKKNWILPHGFIQLKYK